MNKPYRVGFSEPSVKSAWSQRTLEAAGRGSEIVVGPCGTFAFGAVVAICPDKTTANMVAHALNVAAAIASVWTNDE